MHRGDVPGGRDPHAGVDERDRGRVRPHHPSRPERLLDAPYDDRRIVVGGRERSTVPRRRDHRDPDIGRDGERDEIAAGDAAPAQCFDRVHLRHVCTFAAPGTALGYGTDAFRVSQFRV